MTPLAAGGDPAARRELVTVAYRTAIMHQTGGNLTAATQAFARATDLGEQLVAETPDDPESLWLLGEVHASRARAATTRRDHAAVADHSVRAMQLAQRLVQLDPANTDNQAALSTAHNAVGAARLAAGEIEQAADAFRAAIAIRERLVEGQPGDAEFRRSLMIAYGNLGDVLGFRAGQNLGDVAGAIAAFEKAVALADGGAPRRCRRQARDFRSGQREASARGDARRGSGPEGGGARPSSKRPTASPPPCWCRSRATRGSATTHW